METLTTIQNLQDSINKKIIFESRVISQKTVDQFGLITGDRSEHNGDSVTGIFKKPVAQGYLSLALFSNYLKRTVQISGTDSVNMGADNVRFVRPIYIGEPFIPVLTIVSVEVDSKYIKVLWKYELHNEKSKLLLSAVIEARYYPIT